MEVEIDRDLSAIIARRQPTARDLRLLIAISKTIANLERVGDEAARIARTVQRLINTGVSSRLRLPVADLGFEAELAIAQLRKALDAFARLDTAQRARGAEAGRPDRPGVRRPAAQADHLHDGRPAHDLGEHRPGVRRQGDRARRRPRQEPGRGSSTSSRAPTCATTARCPTSRTQSGEAAMSRVLVVEDEPAIAELIAINLRHAGYEVTIAGDADAGAARGRRACCPTWWCSTGCCPASRACSWRSAGARDARTRELPIIMLTARAEEADKIAGLDARRRRLPDQAVLDQGAAGAHPRGAAPQGAARRWTSAVEVGRPACSTRRRAASRAVDGAARSQARARPSSACCTS